MTSITHDEIQCDVRALSRWVAEIVPKPRIGVAIQAYALAGRAITVGLAAQKCLEACPALPNEKPPCLDETISIANRLAREFFLLSKGFGFLSPLMRDKLMKASGVWLELAEDAEDIRDVIEAQSDTSPGIPWEQLKEELGLCPTQ